MSEQEYKYLKILNEFSGLYRHCPYIECGDGWYDLIYELSLGLNNLIIQESKKASEEEREQYGISQIKEKFGLLRCYGYFPEGGDELIELAEKKSANTCETCGSSPAKRSNATGWIRTLCDQCFVKEYEPKI